MYEDFFFQLNLLTPYLLRLQGDKVCMFMSGLDEIFLINSFFLNLKNLLFVKIGAILIRPTRCSPSEPSVGGISRKANGI